MPETTSTGKLIFPIRDAASMQKEGWFIRKTNTKGVDVRLAKIKSSGATVVQAWIFDINQEWTMGTAKKWLKDQKIKWIAELDENTDNFKGVCIKIVKIENNKGECIMAAEKDPKMVENGNGGFSEVPKVIEPGEGLPKKITKSPKKIVTHRKKSKGSNGRPLNLNHKVYDKKVTTPEQIVPKSAEVDATNMVCGDGVAAPVGTVDVPEHPTMPNHPMMPAKKTVKTPKKKKAA